MSCIPPLGSDHWPPIFFFFEQVETTYLFFFWQKRPPIYPNHHYFVKFPLYDTIPPLVFVIFLYFTLSLVVICPSFSKINGVSKVSLSWWVPHSSKYCKFDSFSRKEAYVYFGCLYRHPPPIKNFGSPSSSYHATPRHATCLCQFSPVRLTSHPNHELIISITCTTC